MKVLAAQVNATIGDIAGNVEKILKAIDAAKANGAELVITPELAITGYPPEDFLLLHDFIQKTEEALKTLQEASKGIILIVGTVRRNETRGQKPLYDTAAIFYDQMFIGYQDKTLLPTYDVFDERRYFEPSLESRIWQIGKYKIGITICEDIWGHSQDMPYQQDPIDALSKHPLDLLVNLSASPFHSEKIRSRIGVCQAAALTLKCPVILCNQVGGNDSLIFDGRSMMVNAEGKLCFIGKAFCEENEIIDTTSSPITLSTNPMQELKDALVLGIKDYFFKQGFKKACLGISGGIDSALVACLAVEALGKENVLGVAMPSRFSSDESFTDANDLARRLGIPLSTIPIEGPFESFLNLLKPEFLEKGADVTEENLQARIRGVILMALSNKHGYIVLSTGNKSELALGYSTLYGDMCGGLAVISDLTKEQVYARSRYINSISDLIPESILTKAPSAELRFNQKDTDSLPDYPTVDLFLKSYIELGQTPDEIIHNTSIAPEIVHDLVRRVHKNEFKRRQSPPGLRVSEKAFSVGRRFPIVQRWVE